MDFDDTPDEAAFRAEARAWLESHAVPRDPQEPPASLTDRDRPGVLDAAKAWQAAKREAGWACITWPPEFGGRGGTDVQQVIWRQEEARFRIPPDVYTITHGMAGPMLMVHGTDEQRDRWLPAMVAGTAVWCQLFSEPEAGSDIANLRTRAQRDGDGWLVNGQKVWSSGAHYADWGLLVARTDPSVAKHAGLTYFVVDMATPGVEVRPIRQLAGGAHFNEVFLTDVRIPDENRIAAVGAGWSVVLTTLMNERSSIGADGTGGVDIRELFALARSAGHDAGAMIDDDGVRDRLADHYVRTKGLELITYRTLTALTRGATPGPEGSIGKLVSARMRQEMASLALDLQGLAGALEEPGLTAEDGQWQVSYLWAPGARIGGGTDEILRTIVAERILGLPPEPRVDKGRPFAEPHR